MHKSLKSLSLSLLNIDYVSLDSKWNFDNVISPFTRLYYIDEGSARVYHNGSVFNLTEGNMYLIPSYTYSRYKCDDHMNQYHISFFEEIGNGLSIYNYKSFNYEVKATQQDIQNFKRLLEINPGRGLSNDDPKVYDNYSTLLSFENRNDDMTSSVYIETKGILLSLFSKFVRENFSSSHQDSITTQKVIESVHYINEHLRDNLTIKALAEKCHMNVDYYSRVFKIQFGIGPLSYIQSKRIERAQLLLATTTNSIPEIANKVGVVNISYFSRLFKKITNSSPGEYRRQQWNV